MPTYSKELSYKGTQINITRDVDFNIPKVNGGSKLAALYGLGYVTAEDRLFQMHIKRMVGKGRLSEMVGSKGLSLDILFRQLGVAEICKQASQKMKQQDPIAYQGYQAYADGINDYVKNSGLSVEFYFLWTDFEPWRVVDTFVIGKLVDWVQSADGGLTVLRQLLAQKVGKELAQKMLGWKQQHFIQPSRSLIVNKQQLKKSFQFRDQLNNENSMKNPNQLKQTQQKQQQPQLIQTQSKTADIQQTIQSQTQQRKQNNKQSLNNIPTQQQNHQKQQNQQINIKQNQVKLQGEDIKILNQQVQKSFQNKQLINQNPEIIQTLQQNKAQQISPQLLNFVNGGAGASNSWVISGKHTASGRPHLANDPHMSAVIPSEWFQAEIRYPHQGQEVYVKGVFIAGASLSLVLGKTQYFAWGCTTQYKDTQDLYKQRVQGNKYFVDGQWRDLQQRQQIIRVKNGDDLVLTVSKTHRGPLLSKIACAQKLINVPGNVSFSWTGLNTKYSFLSYLHSVAQFKTFDQTAKYFSSLDDGPSFNLVYITRDDHIGYQTTSGVPKRKGQQSPYFFDGTKTQNDWEGLVSRDQKLHLQNPQKGFIITANSRPSDSNFKGSSIYDTNFQVTSRQYRLNKLIQNQVNSNRKFTIQDSTNYQLDQTDQYCQYILPYLKNLDERFRNLFSTWQCQFSVSSYQASIYEAFLLKLQFKLQPHKDVDVYGLLHFNHYTYKYIIEASNSSDSIKIKQISQSLTQALQMLKIRFKTDEKQKWCWGQLHLTHYSHLPFSNSPLKYIFDRYHSSGGSLNTVKMGKMVKLKEQNFNGQHHAALRMVLTFAPDQSQWIIDTGQSSYPFSNHYDDQQLLHKDGKYFKFDIHNNQKINEQF